jgi:hypothetical protein
MPDVLAGLDFGFDEDGILAMLWNEKGIGREDGWTW